MSFAFSIKKKGPVLKKVDSDSDDEDAGPASKKQKTAGAVCRFFSAAVIVRFRL